MDDLAFAMYGLCETLLPICRSITGDGVRETLKIIGKHLPELTVHEVPTGTRVFDWEVPLEWNIRDAYVIDPDGRKIIDFKSSNLHVVGYSEPVDRRLPLNELNEHLYSLPDQEDAIPYVTSYYKRRWGFCLTERQRQSLKPGEYQVKIDSTLEPGSLTYGELKIKGDSEREIFLSTYVCHPSMANNELSGPVVATFLAKSIAAARRPRYSYRIVFVPETIGAITYLARHLPEMKAATIAGFNLTCCGDERTYSYLPSRLGNTLADRAALHVLKQLKLRFTHYSFSDRASDERQYCSPGVDLPLCSIMRSKYGCYPEYHTSLDDLKLVTPQGLLGTYEVMQKVLRTIELDEILKTTVLCEPQLGKRGLYPTVGTKKTAEEVRHMMDLLAYSDGNFSTLDIAELTGMPLWELAETIEKLKAAELLCPTGSFSELCESGKPTHRHGASGTDGHTSSVKG